MHSAFCNVEFCKLAASEVRRESAKLQYILIGVAEFVGTTFYSRRSRRGLSICIICHKCENRSEFNAFRDSARGNTCISNPGRKYGGRSRTPMKITFTATAIKRNACKISQTCILSLRIEFSAGKHSTRDCSAIIIKIATNINVNI